MSTMGYGVAIHSADPFAGQGASLYVTAGSAVQYRRYLTKRGRSVLRKGWSGRDAKTLRVAVETGISGDTLEFDYSLPAALASQEVTIDVRHFKDDVENLNTAGVHRVTLDGSRNEVEEIRGTATWLTPEVLAGGIVRLRWVYHAADDGVQPTSFRVDFTAGPTSPADIETDAHSGTEYELDTAALDDSGTYTIALYAETDTLSTLLTTQSITADASGPPAPTLVSARAH